MCQNKCNDLICHFIGKQNCPVHLSDNVIKVQRQNTLAELVLAKLKSESLRVRILNRNDCIRILSFRHIRLSETVEMLHNIFKGIIYRLYQNPFHALFRLSNTMVA